MHPRTRRVGELMPRIAIIPGDGIGTEVTREATRVLECLRDVAALDLELVQQDLGAERYLRDGVTITDEEFRSLAEDYDAVFLGALGDPRVPTTPTLGTSFWACGSAWTST